MLLSFGKFIFKRYFKVDIDIGEAETSVVDGLLEKGYEVNILYKDLKKVTLIISSEQK